MNNATSQIVGIDLGTTNCAVSVPSADKYPVLLPISGPNAYTMPSCILWEGDHFVVGHDAYEYRYLPNAVYSSKRFMGTDAVFTLEYHGETLTMHPWEVAKVIMAELKKRTEELVGPVDKCIVTVPAYFNQRQMADTEKACTQAGWTVCQILKEPTSASYIYSKMGYARDGSVLVYDLGGGTFDATYMTFIENSSIPASMMDSLNKMYGITFNSDGADTTDQYFCRVLSTFGDTQLGGDDIDRAIAAEVLKEGGNPNLTPLEFEELVLRCESFKKSGLAGMSTSIGEREFHMNTDMLNRAVEAVFNRTVELIKGLESEHIGTIILVGGSTKNKHLQGLIQDKFPNSVVSLVLDPDSAVAMGAGAVAKDVQNEVDLPYQDVLPLPIGVLVDDTHVEVCLAANTPVPYSAHRKYHTLVPGQKKLQVHLYQGASEDPDSCTYIGCVTVDNLPDRGDDLLSIDISFVLNMQGRLTVVSTVEDHSEQLVIDNIFSNNGSTEDDSLPSWVTRDAFSEVYYPLLKDNEQAIALFKEREAAYGDTVARDAIEDEIFNKFM